MWSVQTYRAVVKVRLVPAMHCIHIQRKAATGVCRCSSTAGVFAVRRAFRKVCRGVMHCLFLNVASVLLLADVQRSRSKLGLIVTVSLGIPLLLLFLTALVRGTVLLRRRARRGASFQHRQSALSVLTDELQVRPLPLPNCMWGLIGLESFLAAGQCHTARLSKPLHHQLPPTRLILSKGPSLICRKVVGPCRLCDGRRLQPN